MCRPFRRYMCPRVVLVSSCCLLQSDPSKPIGFVTKLSDFGLAKLLRDNYYIVNRSGSGTVTHLAPELFQVGSKLTTAVDTFRCARGECVLMLLGCV